MAYNENAFADLLAARQASGDATLAAMQRQRQNDLLSQSGNWHGMAGQGASMGSMFGPQGMAIGAGIGGGLGLLSGYAARKKAGEKGLSALMNTLLSVPSSQSMGQLMQAAPTAMQGYKAYQMGQRNLSPKISSPAPLPVGATATSGGGVLPAGAYENVAFDSGVTLNRPALNLLR